MPSIAEKRVAPSNDPQIATSSKYGGALRTFFTIAKAWELTPTQAMNLLGAAKSTFFKWKGDPYHSRLTRDQVERLSYVLGIYKALQILLPDPDSADTWIYRKNTAPPFGGKSALDRMLGGKVSDLYVVRQYLDAQRGW